MSAAVVVVVVAAWLAVVGVCGAVVGRIAAQGNRLAERAARYEITERMRRGEW